MIIEKDARRYVLKAIEYEKEIEFMESNEKLKGLIVIKSERYKILRKLFIQICCKINEIANVQGNGRNDLNVDILIAAEDILRKITNGRSRAIRILGNRIKKDFNELKSLFKKYSENIEVVDPQLKNNTELIDALTAYEKSWKKGKNFLLNEENMKSLLSMSELIEGLAEKHKEVKEKIENVDADIFIIIPSLVILKSIEEDNSRIYEIYCCSQKGNHYKLFEKIKGKYKQMENGNAYELYNILEAMILEKAVEKTISIKINEEDIKRLIIDIKELAIIMQRTNPTEWNSLMETAMGII